MEKSSYEQAGYCIYTIPQHASSKKNIIGIAADLLELRQRYVKGAKYIRSGDISPTGASAVFDFVVKLLQCLQRKETIVISPTQLRFMKKIHHGRLMENQLPIYLMQRENISLIYNRRMEGEK